MVTPKLKNMIDIKEFLYKVNRTSSIMAQVDWREETDWFDEKRIMYIIKGIKDDEICKMARDYIVTSWYDACGEHLLNGIEFKKLMSSSNEWKFVPVEEDEYGDYELPLIEDLIDKFMVWRKGAIRRQTKKQALDARAREIETSLLMAKNSNADIDAFICGDLFANHYYYESKRLLKENEILKKQLEVYKKSNQVLRRNLAKADIRDLVNEMIKYAEKFPPEQNERALTIKDVLNTKMVNKHIPLGVLDDNLLSRLNNLGLKPINHIDHYYESGSNHNDHSRHLNFKSETKSDKLLE